MVPQQSENKILTRSKERCLPRDLNMHSCKRNFDMRICSNKCLRAARRSSKRAKYLLASERNNLQEQRDNLQYGVEKLSPALQKYYLGKIAGLDGKLAASKKRFPMYRGNYDMY